MDDKEMKDLSDKYGERTKDTKDKWIKYEGPEQLKELIMEHKKKHGWKFKDEE